MEPIVVGIEMGGPEITINASGGGTITRGGNLPENYLQVWNLTRTFVNRDKNTVSETVCA